MRNIHFIKIFLIALLTMTFSCASKGLITERYDTDFYRVDKVLPDNLPTKEQTKFIVYGDNRQAWRVYDKFLRSENWLTWKMLIFPFYELYWMGNGVIGGFNLLRNVPDYGKKERRMVRDAIYTEAQQSKVDFIIGSGDFVTNGLYPEHWAGFIKENKVESPLLLDFPYLPIIGNHEWSNDSTYGLPNYQAIFQYPLFYTVELANATIYVIDSNLLIDQYQLIEDSQQDELFNKWFVSADRTRQPSWLEKELEKSDKKFKIISMHHPIISFNRHHYNWSEKTYGNNLGQKHKQLLKLFQRYGVQVVFCGHEHLYEHNVIEYNFEGKKKMHIVVSGGGGVPLRDPADSQQLAEYLQNFHAQGLKAYSVKREKIYNYCLVDINLEQLRIKTFEVTGKSTQPVSLVEEIVITD